MGETASASLFILRNFFYFLAFSLLLPLAIFQKKFSYNRKARYLHIFLVLILILILIFLSLRNIIIGLFGYLFVIIGRRLCVPVITGGICAGKSTLGQYLHSKNFIVIDSDSINRELLVPGTSAYESLILKFGPEIVLSNGEIDRAMLREIVFNNESKRKILNKCLHKYIVYKIIWDIIRYRILLWKHHLVIEAPLLYDTPLSLVCGPIIVCVASVNTRLRRCQSRDSKIPTNILINIINSQTDDKKLISWGDVIIENESTIEEFHKNAELLMNKYLL